VLLFGMVVRGRFDERPDELGSLEHAERAPVATRPHTTETGRRAGAAATVCAALGVPLTFLSDGGAPLALGVVLLLAAIASAAAYVVPRVALRQDAGSPQPRR
jgi:hypothetical protein